MTSAPPRVSQASVLIAVSGFERAEFQVDAAFADICDASISIQLCDRLDAKAWTKILREVRPEVLVVGWAAPDLPSGYLDDADCPIRYICFFTGSVRRLVPRTFIERGGLVSNWSDAAAPAVAEHALLLTLAALRRLSDWRPFIDLPAEEQNVHPLPLPTRSLRGRTVSLHGFGLIARQLILLLRPFEVRVRAFSAGVPGEFMREHGAEPVETIEALFDQAEILVECEALTPLTNGSVTGPLIDSLAADAVFVNVGRGAVVDEDALARRAARGDLTLALDVVATEPLPSDSMLRKLHSVILSPHIGGGTRDQLPALGLRAADNLRRYLRNAPIVQPLTVDVYDRST